MRTEDPPRVGRLSKKYYGAGSNFPVQRVNEDP